MSASVLSCSNLSKDYDGIRVIEDISLELQRGEFVSVVGQSGVGKTTFLRCLTGLQVPTSGSVSVVGKKINSPPRELGVVFQDYSRSLLPWMSVRRNVMLPLRHLGISRGFAQERCDQALAAVGLEDASSKHPWQLSGGMQQRVAIARALAYRPEVLIMDEPFASVDAQTKFELEDLALKVRESFGLSMILVTHDIDEAVYMSERVLVLSGRPGTVTRVVEVDLPTPRDQATTRSDTRFSELRTSLFHEIAKE